VIYVVKSDAPHVLGEQETKQLLLRLPYRFEFRQVALPLGASGAVAGRIIGAHRTIVNFGITLGSGKPVPVPHAGIDNASGGTAFIVTNDTLVRAKARQLDGGKRQFHTVAQQNEAGQMVLAVEETLCRSGTGKTCPV